jgi:hypothetical protein
LRLVTASLATSCSKRLQWTKIRLAWWEAMLTRAWFGTFAASQPTECGSMRRPGWSPCLYHALLNGKSCCIPQLSSCAC